MAPASMLIRENAVQADEHLAGVVLPAALGPGNQETSPKSSTKSTSSIIGCGTVSSGGVWRPSVRACKRVLRRFDGGRLLRGRR